MAGRGGFNRRGFLKGAAAAFAAPYVLTSAALGAADQPPASERIRMASIGVGAQGGGHLNGLASTSRHLYLWIQSLEFDSGRVGGELPVHRFLVRVPAYVPVHRLRA